MAAFKLVLSAAKPFFCREGGAGAAGNGDRKMGAVLRAGSRAENRKTTA